MGNTIRQTADGGYIFSSQVAFTDKDVTNNHGNKDIWIVKLNAQAKIEWQKTFGGSNQETFNGNVTEQLCITVDGKYVVSI